MTFLTRRVAFFELILLLLVSPLFVWGSGELDTSFPARLSTQGAAWGSRALRLPNGSVIVAGRYSVVNGVDVNSVIRLHADGTLDTAYGAPEFWNPGQSPVLDEIDLQSTGKLLVRGPYNYVGGVTRKYLARLNADGTLDTSFPDLFGSVAVTQFNLMHVLPDDRILVGGKFTITTPSGPRSNLVLLSPDGVVDPSFNYTGEAVGSIFIQPDGKLVLGLTESKTVKRFNADASPDATFTQVSLNNNPWILVGQPDGKILIGGSFTVVNGVTRRALVRVNSDGTIDGTFVDVGLGGGLSSIKLLPDSTIYIAGSYNMIHGSSTTTNIHRLNADGTRDAGFTFFDASYSSIGDIVVEPDGNLIVLGQGVEFSVLRIGPNGNKDVTYSRPMAENAGTGAKVLVLPDNKFLVAGRFTRANGVDRAAVQRFNADGSLDTTFWANGFFTQFGVLDIAVQPDGKVIVSGGADPRRLNTDGTVDISFNALQQTVYDVEVLGDGKVVTAGVSLRRFTSSGALDLSLATVSGVQFSTINKMAVQPDGKIIIVGHFTNVNGSARNYIARINTDGTVDSSFAPQADNDVLTIALQPDGKIIIGGAFNSINGDPNRKYFARLNPNGTIDTSFSPVLDGPVLGIKVQPDGRVLFGGSFVFVGGAYSPRIGRVKADGARDASFNVGTGGNSTVWSIDQQTDGKIILAGEFSRVDERSSLGVARLLNQAPPKFFDYDGDGKTDVSVFRASENKWYILRSSDFGLDQPVFGAAGDIPVPADYDGDRKTDVAIFRPSIGQWWYLSSINGSQIANQLGQAGDIPRPSDFDGDGKADFVAFRPSNSTWYRFGSAAGSVPNFAFGIGGDQPLVGDFDGDGKSDPAVFRPSNGDWWYAASAAGGAFRNVHWGQNGDLPVPADFDGDGKTDVAVFRPSDGGWYIYNSGNGTFTTVAFGTSGDRPVAGDYDGDGRADIAVFRSSSGLWYLLRSTSGFAGAQFGISTDTPTPSMYVP